MGMRIGLIGTGGIAQRHLEALSKNANVEEVYVAEPNADVRENAKKKFALIKKSFADYEELLKEKLDVVDVCVPHYLHHQVVMDCLQQGNDVICEKPIAMTMHEADEMIETARTSGKRLFMEMNQRFMPYHQAAKKLIDDGTIGKPFFAVFNIMGNEFNRMNDPSHWKGTWEKAGGGAMIDTGYHAIYMMLHFFGTVNAVTAVAKRLLVEPENKADDNTVAILEFENRVLGTIAISYTVFAEKWSEKRHIYGTEGSLHIRDECKESLVLTQNNTPRVIETDQPHDVHPHAHSVRRAIDHFIDCLVHDRDPEVAAEEAREALRVALAIYESSRQGKRILL